MMDDGTEVRKQRKAHCRFFWLSMSSPTPAYSRSHRSGRRKQSVTRTVVQAPSSLSDQRW